MNRITLRELFQIMGLDWTKTPRIRDVYISKRDAEFNKERLEKLLVSSGFDLNGSAKITEINKYIVCYSHIINTGEMNDTVLPR